MKKIILVIVAVTFMANNIIAQDNSSDNRDKLQFGLKAGMNFSNVYDTKGQGFVADSKVGFVGGAFLAIPIGKFLGLQPELLFSQKGFKGKFIGIEYTHTTNFIDVPLLISLKPSEFVSLLAGPQFSFLMSQKDKIVNTSLSHDISNDNLRKSTFCFLGGIDFNLANVVLGLRAGWDIQDNNGDGTTVPRYKNVWYQVAVGLKF